ncbi:hypothetical protein ACROYT_G034321 [Oculina patagonica]
MNSSIHCNITENITVSNDSTCGAEQEVFSDPYEDAVRFAFGSAIYMIVVAFITIVANALLLLVLLIDPLKTFKNPTSYFLIGLAISDLLTGMIQLPLFSSCFIFFYLQGPERGLILCDEILLPLGETQAAITMTISFLIVFAFTFTQFVIVSSPLKYARMATSRKVAICVVILYVYTILLWVSQYWGVPIEVLGKIDVFLHSLTIPYATIIIYILLHRTFKRKMAASKMLSSDRHIQRESNESQSNRIQRKFITVNCILIAILFFCSQPTAIFWLLREFWFQEITPQLLIINLMIDNILYLKIMLDPFVYAWRLPKYREALRVICPVLKKCRRKSRYEKRIEESVIGQSRETIMTLDIRKIEGE